MDSRAKKIQYLLDKFIINLANRSKTHDDNRFKEYSSSSCHPENQVNGVNSMTLIDLIEMLSVWKAATERNKDGNIRTSIDVNSQKYKISPQLKEILENTVREYFKD